MTDHLSDNKWILKSVFSQKSVGSAHLLDLAFVEITAGVVEVVLTSEVCVVKLKVAIVVVGFRCVTFFRYLVIVWS